ncbi:MAG: V-type ATP synthase subunit F [Dehalococcoidales bacterium]|nr:V-type ATP synthase subunit F [Dehalococcoidales bacterium]
MMPRRSLSIAVIGDQDLVNGFRLGGLKRYQIIEEGQNIGEEVRKTLSRLLSEPDIGVIVIQENYVKYVEDLMAQVEQEKRITPVILGLPKYGTKQPDVAEYYRGYIRKIIGFDVEV